MVKKANDADGAFLEQEHKRIKLAIDKVRLAQLSPEKTGKFLETCPPPEAEEIAVMYTQLNDIYTRLRQDALHTKRAWYEKLMKSVYAP